jgi:diguanylate cyclase
MRLGGPNEKPVSQAADALAATGAGHGPATLIRELARDLLRQKRIQLDEASRIDRALRDHDWATVRTYVAKGLARRTEAPSMRENGAASAPAAAAETAERTMSPEGAADDGVITAGLLRLVLRLCDALPRLAVNDLGFIEGFDLIRSILAGRLTPERLNEVDARIATLVSQQLEMQQKLQDARSSLKDMLSMLVDRLGTVGTSTAQFQQRVGAYREELAGQPEPGVVTRVVVGLLAETKAVSEELQRSQQDLAEAHRKVESYELRVRNLEHALAQTARMVRNDPLTHALNRRGLDEVFRIEASRSSRYRVPLTLVMIDLDDFKSINDSLGHAAGDRALVHFVTTAQASLRSMELIARTGGEEFVVVFPATGIEESVDAIRRLQRELARSEFQYEGESRAMTFSGGAAAWRAGESLPQILRRADAAMYEAKRAGKNSVVIATE